MFYFAYPSSLNSYCQMHHGKDTIVESVSRLIISSPHGVYHYEKMSFSRWCSFRVRGSGATSGDLSGPIRDRGDRYCCTNLDLQRLFSVV